MSSLNHPAEPQSAFDKRLVANQQFQGQLPTRHPNLLNVYYRSIPTLAPFQSIAPPPSRTVGDLGLGITPPARPGPPYGIGATDDPFAEHGTASISTSARSGTSTGTFASNSLSPPSLSSSFLLSNMSLPTQAFAQTSASGDASPFQTHLLALLSSISAAPSPSYPFPDAQADLPLRAFSGPKTAVEEALERGVLAIGERLKLEESNPMAQAAYGQPQQQHARGASSTRSQPPQAQRGQSQQQLLTPDWTPPINDAAQSGKTAVSSSPTTLNAFAMAAGLGHDTTCPTCHRSAVTTPTQQHPSSILKNISTSPQTPTNVIQDPFPALVSGSWAGDTGMSAEKELELLKAQVQDIARVCKVSCCIHSRKHYQRLSLGYS